MIPSELSRPSENRILAALPQKDLDTMLPHLEPVSVPLGAVLFEPNAVMDSVYFVESGMVSLVALTQEGETFEVGVVGNLGIVGVTVFFEEKKSHHRAIVQANGTTALAMKTSAFKTLCDQIPGLQQLVRRYSAALFRQITQTAICTRFHGTDARLRRWLLQTRDCVKSNSLYLTQEFLAQMLGIYRPGVTLAARTIQNAGLIKYSRGHITITDQDGLQAASCECYKVISESYDWIFE